MNIYSLVKHIGAFFMGVGALVMIGWVANIPLLLVPLPNTPLIRFPTALTIFLAGFLLRSFYRLEEGDKKGDAIARIMMCSALFLLVFFPHLVGYFWHIQVGLDSIIDPIPINGVLVQYASPSIGTIFCMGILFFMSFVVGAGYSISKFSKWGGFSLLAISGLALVGYLINEPSFYFSTGGSQGMAVITASSFALIGFTFIMLGLRPHTDHHPEQEGVSNASPKT